MATIKSITAREILDSRGIPTIETKVTLKGGFVGIASIPSGASVGKYEALELRDGDPKRYGGLGVLKAVAKVEKVIAPALIGMEARLQLNIDKKMIKLDGTPNKSKLGANTILTVSQGVCEAAAASKKVANYKHVADLYGLKKKDLKIPVPIFNLINGGKHGAGNLEFQEFQVIPSPSRPYRESLRLGEEVYQQIKKILMTREAVYSVGDEGGFTPSLFTNVDGLELLVEAIKTAGYLYREDAFLGLDAAATHFYQRGKYKIRDRTMPMSTDDLIGLYREFTRQYPLLLLEDPLDEDDWIGWRELASQLPAIILVGDDLLATNYDRVKKAIKEKACSAVLIKPNQVGTISEAIKVIKTARQADWKTIVSHRSGESEDDFIADFAVGVGADYAKFGAPARGERVAKYNRLLEIEEELNKSETRNPKS